MLRQKHTERKDKEQKEKDRENCESGKKTNKELGINRERKRERQNVKKKEFVLQSDKMKVVVISFGKNETKFNFFDVKIGFHVIWSKNIWPKCHNTLERLADQSTCDLKII